MNSSREGFIRRNVCLAEEEEEAAFNRCSTVFLTSGGRVPEEEEEEEEISLLSVLWEWGQGDSYCQV